MSAPWVFSRTIDARLQGTPLDLTLSYRVVDPIAITITLRTRLGPASWSVARDVLRDGLDPDRVPVYADEATTKVHLTTVPSARFSLLTLRSDGGVRWPLAVPCAELRDFLAQTYQACSPEREARTVAEEMDAQICFMQMTTEVKKKGRKRR